MTKTIFISAYPKSGSTYLTNLLGDVLNCPTGGNRQQEDSTEVATKIRPNYLYMVRKGHYKLCSETATTFGRLIPSPHVLNWQLLDNHHRVIFLIRNPKDICVSGAHHWRVTPKEFLQRMFRGSVTHLSRWDDYVKSYLNIMDTRLYSDLFHVVKYEDLLSNPQMTLSMILSFIGQKEFKKYRTNITQAIYDNQFQRVKAGKTPKQLRQLNMRKGISGDWVNHFDREMNDMILREFGDIMKLFEYQ